MNAIIMAAGLGSRFKEVTKTCHKALLPIGETPNLERTIGYLHEAGIQEIHILTGHLGDTFNYLPEKFPGVTLHFNEYYQKYNSIYTFKLALPYFSDSFVIDGDTVFAKNIFNQPEKTTYFTMVRQEEGTEWCPVTNENGKVVEMLITSKKLPAMTGITYWDKKDAEKIKAKFPNYLAEKKLLDPKGYWDDIPVAILNELDAQTKILPQGSIYEMDNQEEYQAILRKLG